MGTTYVLHVPPSVVITPPPLSLALGIAKVILYTFAQKHASIKGEMALLYIWWRCIYYTPIRMHYHFI